MSNLKVVWPTVIALALGLSITSCMHGEFSKKSEVPKVDVPKVTQEYEIKEITEEDLPEIEYVKDGDELKPVVVEEKAKTR